MVHHHEEHPDLISRNARVGLILFAVYVALYAGFIFMATFWPEALAADAPAGLNWAIVYGFALIGAAFLLALVYMALCGRACQEQNSDDEGAE